MVLNGVCVFGLAYSGCNLIAAVFFFTMSLTLHGAVSSGTLASIVDIGPNFAGITLGIVGTVAILTGFISPIIVGYLTFENQSISAWQHIFEICAGMLITCGVIFIWFNDTTLQAWNKVPKVAEFPKELLPLYTGEVVSELKENEIEQKKNEANVYVER